jgi:hypothetical protein
VDGQYVEGYGLVLCYTTSLQSISGAATYTTNSGIVYPNGFTSIPATGDPQAPYYNYGTLGKYGSDGFFSLGSPSFGWVTQPLPVRQDINDLNYSDIRKGPETNVYVGSAIIPSATLGQGTNLSISSACTSGWCMTDGVVQVVISFNGNITAPSTIPPYQPLQRLIMGMYTREANGYFLDTKGRSIRQYLGVKFMDTTFKNISASIGYWLVGTSLIQNALPTGGYGTTEYGTPTINPNAFNLSSGGGQAGAWFTGSSGFNGPGFTATLTLAYGAVPGALRIPTNTKITSGSGRAYFTPVTLQGNATRGFYINDDTVTVEKRHQQMMDAALLNGTTLCTLTFSDTDYWGPNPSLATPTNPTSNSPFLANLGDQLLSGLSSLSDYVPGTGNIIFITVSLDITPTGTQSLSETRDAVNGTIWGPDPTFNLASGVLVTGVGFSKEAANNSNQYALLFGDLQLNTQNRFYQ